MKDQLRKDCPLNGLYRALHVAAQAADEAFAGSYGANYVTTLTIPGRKIPSRWPAPEAAPAIAEAIESYAAGMVNAYGIDRSSLVVDIKFARDAAGLSAPFYQVTLAVDDPGAGFPAITIKAWRDTQTETLTARRRR